MKRIILVSLILIFTSCKKEKGLHIVTKKTPSIIKNQDTTKHKSYADLNSNKEYDSIVESLTPSLISEKEFENCKMKSNYIKAIEKYDTTHKDEIYGNGDIPTVINEQKYLTNTILFGDLNGDKKRDCIIIIHREGGYDFYDYYYVFINKGDEFKLTDVQTDNDICGCIYDGGWPNLLRYQKIEDGMLHGISMCHQGDAHCCPSVILRTKIKLINKKLQFQSSEFIFDDYPGERPETLKLDLDKLLIKSK